MTEVAEAEALIRARMPRWEPVRVPLPEAGGRVLAETVEAERDQPPFDRVTMDGIAIRFSDWAAGRREYESIGVQAAGAPALAVAAPGECVQIMTGAVLPEGTDTIVPIERVARDGRRCTVERDAKVTQRQNVHARGSDGREGDTLLRAGLRLGAPEIAVLASAGRARVAVSALPKAAVVATGDELADVDEKLAPHRIRSCNDYAVAAALEGHGVAEVTRVRLADDPDELLAATQALHDAHDVLILSGGVSMGEFDFVPSVLERLGAELVFHRIEQRPGRPMWFGMSRDGKPIFALPGNPVSTLVCTTRYLLPALRAAAGLRDERRERVRLAAPVTPPRNLTCFLPVTIRWSEAGLALAEPRPTNTSGDFVSLAGTDGFVELAGGPEDHPEGTAAALYRW